MSFFKSVVILKQTENGYSANNKTLSGIARIETENENSQLYLTLVNMSSILKGELYLFLLGDNEKTFAVPVLNCNGVYTKIYGLENCTSFSMGLFYVENSLPTLIAYGESENANGSSVKLKKCFSEFLITRLKEDKKSKDYDDEVVATENYYLNDEELKEKLRLIKGVDENEGDLFERSFGDNKEETNKDPKETNGNKNGADFGKSQKFSESDPYFKSVRKELEDIFTKFKKEEILENRIPDSKWVKIYFSEDKYYVVGLVKEDGKVKYICYGVPSNYKETPPPSLAGYCSFVPLSIIKLKGEGYWMMFQDAITGECVPPE